MSIENIDHSSLAPYSYPSSLIKAIGLACRTVRVFSLLHKIIFPTEEEEIGGWDGLALSSQIDAKDRACQQYVLSGHPTLISHSPIISYENRPFVRADDDSRHRAATLWPRRA